MSDMRGFFWRSPFRSFLTSWASSTLTSVLIECETELERLACCPATATEPSSSSSHGPGPRDARAHIGAASLGKPVLGENVCM